MIGERRQNKLRKLSDMSQKRLRRTEKRRRNTQSSHTGTQSVRK